jgi:hypothetical protein
MSRFEYAALAANKVVGNSGWIDTSMLAAGFSITIEGVGASDACDVRASNRQAIPGPDYIGLLYSASSVTADVIVKVMETYRWVMVRRLTAGGSPLTVEANIFGVTSAAR